MREKNGKAPKVAALRVQYVLDDAYFAQTGLDFIDSVKDIIADVKRDRDAAVRSYAKRFDSFGRESFVVSKERIKDAYSQLNKDEIDAIRYAADKIRIFSTKQLKQIRPFRCRMEGMLLGQSVIPIEKVGCYVPGGRYPLPSSCLMSVVPAKLAGVKQVIVCSPNIKPAVIVAADIAGADIILDVGGVQAIAALAFGTETIPKVDKIVGPGNRFVTAAKKELYGTVGIDFLAGPSEIMIIADDSGDPRLIAADMLSQSEHDPNARSDLITTSARLAEAVIAEIQRQLPGLITRDVAQLSLKNSRFVIVKDLNAASDIANRRAPEHLELQVKEPDPLVKRLSSYGSLFIGTNAAEVFGDYCSGTNHILPTGMAARYCGGLSVKDFVKILTWQKANKPNKKLIRTAAALAAMEGLDAHKKAALARQK